MDTRTLDEEDVAEEGRHVEAGLVRRVPCAEELVRFDTATVSTIAVVYNIGAMLGGLFFGTLSQKIGRRWAIAIAALLSLAAIPLWAFGTTPVTIGFGAFLMQFFVQGAWGVVPVHLNELSPPLIRGTFPGFVYQLGNVLASGNATIQSMIGDRMGHNYSWALAGVAGTAAVVVAVFMTFGKEARHVLMGAQAVDPVEAEAAKPGPAFVR